MSGLTPIQMAANVNEIVHESGMALYALADILNAVDEERLKSDYPHAGLSYLLKIIGRETLQNTDHVNDLLAAAHTASAGADAPPG